MQNKPRFDRNSPEIKAYLEDVAQTFTREGTLIALKGVRLLCPGGQAF
jgi:hypothetical protein